MGETIDSFEALVNGDLDHLPEQAFYMVGGASDVERKADGAEGLTWLVAPWCPAPLG